jgi:hypothetical protein
MSAALSRALHPRVHSGLCFFKTGYQVEDLVGRSPQLPDDLAILSVVLALERARRLIDVPQALRYFLALGIGYPKNPTGRRGLFFYLSPTWITISMTRPAGMGHECLATASKMWAYHTGRSRISQMQSKKTRRTSWDSDATKGHVAGGGGDTLK